MDPYEHPESPSAPADLLRHHRTDIDRVDRVIVALLAERLRLGLALGDVKRTHGLPVQSTGREEEVLASVRTAACAYGWLPPEAVERIFSAVIAETRAVQEGRE
ncbi:MAG: chorismate mutase [Acidobacteriota bacterium]|nr:chorismate mutase [Acidobacteriota bacterium]